MKRRDFIRWSVSAGVAGPFLGSAALSGAALGAATPASAARGRDPDPMTPTRPIVCSTWNHGVAANAEAMKRLARGDQALDAVEAGVAISEADPSVTSVGYGGFPNREGVMQLDAAIQDGRTRDVGAVACLEGILHPIQVARRVLDATPHVLVVGKDAQRFALSEGFELQDLLTDDARAAWERWKKEQSEAGKSKKSKKTMPPGAPGEDHDTIGQLAIDTNGDIAAACTTSGLAWKLPGRVGDSPIIGSGLYCENGVGGATATGLGEEVLKVCGSFLAVENLRRGMSPTDAARDVVKRVIGRSPDNVKIQVAVLVLRSDGAVGAAAIKPGFQYAVSNGEDTKLIDVPGEAS